MEKKTKKASDWVTYAGSHDENKEELIYDILSPKDLDMYQAEHYVRTLVGLYPYKKESMVYH